jgi:hypothetical protein
MDKASLIHALEARTAKYPLYVQSEHADPKVLAKLFNIM